MNLVEELTVAFESNFGSESRARNHSPVLDQLALVKLLSRNHETRILHLDHVVVKHVHKVLEADEWVAEAFFSDHKKDLAVHLFNSLLDFPLLCQFLFPDFARRLCFDGVGGVNNRGHILNLLLE